MVDGKELRASEFAEHGPDLFRRGVGVFPGFVAADAEDGEVDGFEFGVGVGEGGVAGEEDSLRADGEDVAVVAAVTIPRGASAPVAGLDGFDFEVFEDGGLVPIHFEDIGEAGWDEALGGLGGNDHRGRRAEALERGLIEMIEVRMADEDDVDRGQVLGLKRRIADAGEADCALADLDADAAREDGIGEDVEMAEADENGAVTEPADDDVGAGAFAFAGPGLGEIGGAWCVIVKVAEIGELLDVSAHARTQRAGPELEFGLLLPVQTHAIRILDVA